MAFICNTLLIKYFCVFCVHYIFLCIQHSNRAKKYFYALNPPFYYVLWIQFEKHYNSYCKCIMLGEPLLSVATYHTYVYMVRGFFLLESSEVGTYALETAPETVYWSYTAQFIARFLNTISVTDKIECRKSCSREIAFPKTDLASATSPCIWNNTIIT